ncbi:2'-5' RNA ligase family protein [Sediminibacterium roseum]|nr:2'-5' RNA ligase family protein [Sediminibacterium roseum]
MEMLADYATADYLLVIEPHAALCDEISKVKKKFAGQYDCPAAATGTPNITLARFEQYEMLEQKIVHRLELIARGHPSFLVEVNGFESYPTHSIFLNVVTKTQIVELVKALRPIQHLLKIDKERKPHFITEPHIGIANKLLPWQYEKGWLEMSNTHFSGKFMAEHLLLLRKRDGEKRFEVVRRFGLLNEKETVVQGELFFLLTPGATTLRKERS